MSIFYVCRFCGVKVSRTYLARHTLGQHFERCYREVILGEQTQFAESGEIIQDDNFEQTITKDEVKQVSEAWRFKA